MGGPEQYDISVIVPAYNAGATLGDCVRSVLASRFEGRLQVVVVDDGSTDGSLERIRELPVEVITQENRGAAAARNAGARAAKSRNLFFVDSDVVVLPDTVQKVHRYLQRKGVMYVSLLYSPVPRNTGWINWYKATWNYFYDYHFPFSGAENSDSVKHAFLSGGAEAYTRLAFETLRGYDESLRGTGVEREEMFLRLRKRFPESSIISDGSVQTQHYFPGLGEILRRSYSRTSELMRLICRSGYSQPFVRRNFLRVASASFTSGSLIGAALLALLFHSLLPLSIPLAGFLAFVTLHLPMFRYTLRERGILLTAYAVPVAILHISSISLGSIAGFINYRMLKR